MKSYVKYDDLGAIEICCMNCGVPIVVRTYTTIEVKGIPPKEVNVLAMRQLSSFRKRRFEILDNSYIEAMLCNDCVDLPLSPDKIEEAVKEGWIETWKHEHKSKREIKKLEKKLPVLEGSVKSKEKLKDGLRKN